MNTQATVMKNYTALLQPSNTARKACPNLFFRWSALFVLLVLAAESHAQMTVSLTPAWNAWAYNVSSYGGADGSIASSVTGGTTPFSYVWTKGSDTIGTTQNANSLTAGLYQLIVEDSLGQRDTASVYLSQPSGLSASITPHDPCGLASNSATAYPTGAVGPYSYAWDTGDSVATANGLSAGVHAVLITAANGDTVTTHCTIHTPLALEMSVTANSYGNHLACDGDTATLDLTVSGGVPPYTYLWESGSFSQDLQAITGGLKKVRVWDSRGCMADDSLLLVAASALNMEVQPHLYPNGQGFSCDTCNDGMFVVMNIGGGEPPYTIAWSTGATGDTLFNIIPDTTYTITITDAQGCTLSDGGAMPRGNLQADNSLSVVIDAPHWAGGYHVSCSTCSDAKVLLYPSGGQPPYAILWADGDTSRYRYDMAAGDYTVTIFDQMGDSLVRNITLIGPGAGLDAQISNMTTMSNGLITGGLNAMVNGGVPPYSYVWKKDGNVLMNTWSYLSVSQTGTYSLKVTDATNGVDSATVVISLPEDTTMEAAAPPAWGMYGNAGNGDILEGEGTPWFGTADSTDVVMKANGVPQLRLGANGVTSVEGQLRLSNTVDNLSRMLWADENGLVRKLNDTVPLFDTYESIPVMNDSMGQLPEGFAPPVLKSGILGSRGGGCPPGEWKNLLISTSEGSPDMQPCFDGNIRIGGGSFIYNNVSYESWANARLHVHAKLAGAHSKYNLSLSRESVNTSYRVGVSTNTENKNILLFDALTNSNGSPFGGFAQVLSLQQDGNVGIGTRTPGSRLSVSGDIDITGNRLHVNATSGNVGIGTNNPQARLDVRETNGGLALQVLDDREVVIGPFISAQNPNVTLYFGDDRSHYIRSSYTGGLSFSTYQAEDAMVIHEGNGGRVQIGPMQVTSGPHAYPRLSVDGKIVAREFFVTTNINYWSDYVFDKEYVLRPICEVEEYITKHGHLPDVPSANEVSSQGQDLGKMDAILLRKIEELTLYVIELEKRLNEKCGE